MKERERGKKICGLWWEGEKENEGDETGERESARAYAPESKR